MALTSQFMTGAHLNFIATYPLYQVAVRAERVLGFGYVKVSKARTARYVIFCTYKTVTVQQNFS